MGKGGGAVSLTCSVLLTAIFRGGPWLADTRMSLFWILLELRMMEVVVMTTGAMKRAKLQPNRHHQQTNTQLYTGYLNKSPARVYVCIVSTT